MSQFVSPTPESLCEPTPMATLLPGRRDPAPDLLPYRLSICGLEELAQHARNDVTHVVSIIDPAQPDPEDFADYPPHDRTLWRFDDIIGPRNRMITPVEADVQRILDLGERLAGEPVRHLLVHCHAGVSRSTATAALLMAQFNPGRDEDIFRRLDAMREPAWPNSLIIRMGDALLGRGGTLVAALRDHHDRVAQRFPGFAAFLRANGRAHEVPDTV